MAKWEFAVAVRDEVEPHRKKEGDLIAVKPYPWQWGRKEINAYLIVVLDGLTKDEAHRLCAPLYEDGSLEQPDPEISDPKIMAKRRFKIPLETIKNGWLPSLDLERVRNIKDVYQPLKETETVLDTKEPVAICFDKYLGSFKFAEAKVI